MNSKAQEQKEKESQALTQTKTVHKGKVLHVRLDTYEIDGRKKAFEIIEHPGAVVLIPIDQHNRILLIQQWRRAAQEIVIELPAGTLHPQEDPLACAQRELREETGFRSDLITPLGGFFSAPGFCEEYLHLFLAEHLVSDPLPPDEDEQIDLLHLSIPEAIHLIEQNKIRDAKTIAGILRYQLYSDGKSHGKSNT